MTKTSIRTNAILNMIRVALGVLFPLITYPYATRVLGVDNIGKIQFGLSVISYFSLLAALGVSTYGTRQGAALRGNAKKFSKFASEIFSINVLSTCISYLALIVLMVIPSQLSDYRLLIFIQSLVIIFNTISVDWVYNAQEDFLYITLRAVIVQILSIILLFVLIRRPDDYYLYAAVTTVATAGSSLFNFFHARKYCKIHLTTSLNLKQHIKPLLALFGSAIAVQVYLNSDIVMLGLMQGNASVGLYSVPVKVYTIIKSILNATIVVSIPRFSYYVAQQDADGLNRLSSKIINISLVAILPCALMLFLLSEPIVRILAGAEYSGGALSLRILSLALPFAVASNFLGNAILVSYKLEKKFLIATTIGAILNIVLNLVSIPLFAQNGAAITTVLAEIGVMIICGLFSKGLFSSSKTRSNILQSLVACCGIIAIYMFVHVISPESNLLAVISGILGLATYVIILYIEHNTVITELLDSVIKKLKREKNKDANTDG